MQRGGPSDAHGVRPARRIARELGVSLSTVSRAFSARRGIAAATREKVLRRARELGYRPDPFARTLITRRNNIVAIVVSDLDNPFYPAVLTRMVARLQDAGYHAMLFACTRSRAINETVDQALRYRPGVLIALAVTLSSGAAGQAAAAGTRVLFFNRYIPRTTALSVTCDNVGGGAAIADFLLDRGHRELVFLSGHPEASTNIDRRAGFAGRCVERTGRLPRIVDAGDFSHQAGFAAAPTLFASSARPSAVFCANDVIALGVLDAAREHGLAVPGELSVVGFDDIEAAAWASYRLTTYRQPVAAMIDASIALIQQIGAESEAPMFETIEPGEIVERHTVAHVPRSGPTIGAGP